MQSQYSTYWIIGNERVSDVKVVERRVVDGEVAIEVSSEMQQKAAERRQRLLDYEAGAAELRAAEAHRRSPEGTREAALHDAAQHPGGRVSIVSDGCAELDAYRPVRTSLL